MSCIGWGGNGSRAKTCLLWPSHPCAPCSPSGPCSRFAELFTTGLSTFGRTILKPAPSPLASLFVSDLLCFFSFPALLADLLLLSIDLFSCLPCSFPSALWRFYEIALLPFAPYFAEALNTAFFCSLQVAWRPLASWTTPLRGLGLAYFCLFLSFFFIFYTLPHFYTVSCLEIK